VCQIGKAIEVEMFKPKNRRHYFLKHL